jgi:Rad51
MTQSSNDFNPVSQHDHRSMPSFLKRKNVIEIQGPSIGKTHLLMHFIISCITPYQYLSVNIDGWNKAAIVLDVDHTFDMRRFRQLLSGHLSRVLAPLSLHNDFMDQLTSSLLQNLHVFRPNSSFHLAFTIMNLANYHSINLPQTEIGLVAIDSVSAFYWQDRFHAEQLRDFGSSSTQKITSGIEHALRALETFRQSHGSIVILTNWGLNQLSKTSLFYKQHLYPLNTPFDSNPIDQRKPAIFVTHHITLRGTVVPTIQAQDDVRIERNEQEVVEALVRTVGSSVGVTKFRFCVTDTETRIIVENHNVQLNSVASLK